MDYLALAQGLAHLGSPTGIVAPFCAGILATIVVFYLVQYSWSGARRRLLAVNAAIHKELLERRNVDTARSWVLNGLPADIVDCVHMLDEAKEAEEEEAVWAAADAPRVEGAEDGGRLGRRQRRNRRQPYVVKLRAMLRRKFPLKRDSPAQRAVMAEFLHKELEGTDVRMAHRNICVDMAIASYFMESRSEAVVRWAESLSRIAHEAPGQTG